MITIGSGITVGAGIEFKPVVNPLPFLNQIINIDAGDSKSFSGSGIAYYGVDGGIGAHDLSGHNNIAQLTNGVAWINRGNASYFNFASNSNQYLDCNIINSTPLASGDYTYFAMVRQGSFDNRAIITSTQTLFYWTDTGGLNNGPQLIASNRAGTPDVADSATEFLTDVWYGVAVTYAANTGTMKLYVNGTNTATSTGVVALSSAQPIYIGDYQVSSATEDGNLSVALVYQTALDAETISLIYNYYSARYVPVATTSSAFYDVPGSYTWVCPSGVNSVSVLAIGAGGGGTQDAYSPPGGDSYFVDNLTCWAQGGPEITGSSYTGPPAQYTGDGGGLGGTINTVVWGVGGAGSGGYTGQGGSGAFFQSPGSSTPGTGGGGGGGGARNLNSGGGGGGVGIYGLGSGGSAGTFDIIANNTTTATGGGGGSGGESGGDATAWNGGRGGLYGGGGGSSNAAYLGGNGGALAWINNYTVTPGASYTVVVGDGGLGDGDGGSGAPGCVRIVWPGNTRQFPTTNVGPDN